MERLEADALARLAEGLARLDEMTRLVRGVVDENERLRQLLSDQASEALAVRHQPYVIKRTPKPPKPKVPREPKPPQPLYYDVKPSIEAQRIGQVLDALAASPRTSRNLARALDWSESMTRSFLGRLRRHGLVKVSDGCTATWSLTTTTKEGPL